jgi:hypothetical protein
MTFLEDLFSDFSYYWSLVKRCRQPSWLITDLKGGQTGSKFLTDAERVEVLNSLPESTGIYLQKRGNQ